MRADAIGRVQIQRDGQAAGVQPRDQIFRVREQLAIPRPPRPSGLVPIHVQHEHIQREAVDLELVHDAAELVRGVWPVARVPRTESVFSGHRNAPSDHGQRPERGTVVIAIREKIPVRVLVQPHALARRGPVVDQEMSRRIVHHMPTVARQQTLPDRVRSAQTIKGAERAAEIVEVARTGRPEHSTITQRHIGGRRRVLDNRVHVPRVRRVSIRRVRQGESLGAHPDPRRSHNRRCGFARKRNGPHRPRDLRIARRPVDRKQRGMIAKFSMRRVLNAHALFTDDGDTDGVQGKSLRSRRHGVMLSNGSGSGRNEYRKNPNVGLGLQARRWMKEE